MALPSFKELREVDVEPYCKKRDGILYLPWAKCMDLLHEYGAETVYFLPVIPDYGNGSLRMTEQEFADKNGNINRCYETCIDIFIDDKVYRMVSPVMNGANPVKDNSMSQQRVWNSMTRSFVKGVAIYTGLGFNLWAQSETKEDESAADELGKHDIRKVQERVLETMTSLNKSGLSAGEIAQKMGMDEEVLRAKFTLYKELYDFEKKLNAVKK